MPAKAVRRRKRPLIGAFRRLDALLANFHESLQSTQNSCAYPRDLQQLLHAAEAAVSSPVGEDGLGSRAADTGKSRQLDDPGGIHIDRTGPGAGAAAPVASPHTAWPKCDVRRDALEDGRPDARNAAEVLQRDVRPMGLPIVNDGKGFGGSYPRETFELLGGRGVGIHPLIRSEGSFRHGSAGEPRGDRLMHLLQRRGDAAARVPLGRLPRELGLPRRQDEACSGAQEDETGADQQGAAFRSVQLDEITLPRLGLPWSSAWSCGGSHDRSSPSRKRHASVGSRLNQISSVFR